MTDPQTSTNQPPALPASSTARPSSGRTTADGTSSEISRLKTFLWIQILFLLASPLAGGFHYRLWSMLDTALLLIAIGITNLAFVVESRSARRLIFQVSATCYIAGVLDMAVNVLISGVLGWGKALTPPIVG